MLLQADNAVHAVTFIVEKREYECVLKRVPFLVKSTLKLEQSDKGFPKKCRLIF